MASIVRLSEEKMDLLVNSYQTQLSDVIEEREKIISSQDIIPFPELEAKTKQLGYNALALQQHASAFGWEKMHQHAIAMYQTQKSRALCRQAAKDLGIEFGAGDFLKDLIVYGAMLRCGYGECGELTAHVFIKIIEKGIKNAWAITACDNATKPSKKHFFIILNASMSEMNAWQKIPRTTFGIDILLGIEKLKNSIVYDPLNRCLFTTRTIKKQHSFVSYIKENNYLYAKELVHVDKITPEYTQYMVEIGKKIYAQALSYRDEKLDQVLSPAIKSFPAGIASLEGIELCWERLSQVFHSIVPKTAWKKSKKPKEKIWITASIRITEAIGKHLGIIPKQVKTTEDYCVMLEEPTWEKTKVIPTYDKSTMHSLVVAEMTSVAAFQIFSEEVTILELIAEYDF